MNRTGAVIPRHVPRHGSGLPRLWAPGGHGRIDTLLVRSGYAWLVRLGTAAAWLSAHRPQPGWCLPRRGRTPRAPTRMIPMRLAAMKEQRTAIPRQLDAICHSTTFEDATRVVGRLRVCPVAPYLLKLSRPASAPVWRAEQTPSCAFSQVINTQPS